MTSPTTAVPDRVRVCEVVLRDGIQGWPDVLPTADKLRLLEAVCAAGFDEVDVTSFVPARSVPQFVDAVDVLAAVPDGVRTRVLAPNLKGVERVASTHRKIHPIDFCGIPFSASEAHNVANLRRTHAAHREQLEPMLEQLLAAGVAPLVAVATAFGCPIAGRVEPDQVLEIAGWLHERGVRHLMLSDTTGMADPARAGELFRAARAEWPDAELVAHFHDNRGAGIANTVSAVAAGASTVDSCLGGLGGEPQSVDQGEVGESGNVVTEDLVALLERMGTTTGLDLDAVLTAGAVLETVVGRRLHSRVQLAGLVAEPAAGGV